MIDPHTTLAELQDLTGMTERAFRFLSLRGVRTFDDFMRYDPRPDMLAMSFRTYREIRGLQRDLRDQLPDR